VKDRVDSRPKIVAYGALYVVSLVILVSYSFGHTGQALVRVDAYTGMLILLLAIIPQASRISKLVFSGEKVKIDLETPKQRLQQDVEHIDSQTETANLPEEVRRDFGNRERPRNQTVSDLSSRLPDAEGADPITTIANLTSEIEARLREILLSEGLSPDEKATLQFLANQARENELIQSETANAIETLWSIRNRLVHGGAVDREDAETIALAGTKVLDTLQNYLEVSEVTEVHLREILAENPELVEPGFEIRSVEERVGNAHIDVIGEDASGETVVVELKLRPITEEVVKQAQRRLETWKTTRSDQTARGIIVAPDVESGAKESLDQSAIEFRELKTIYGK